MLGLGLVLAAAGLLLGVHDLTRVGALLVALPFIARFLVGRRLDLEVERAVVPAMVAPGSAAIVDLRLRNTGRVTSPQLCLLYTSPSPRAAHESRMPSSA